MLCHKFKLGSPSWRWQRKRTYGGFVLTWAGSARLWHADNGIQHQLTERYTAQHNGTAEPFIRTTKEMVATMLHVSDLGHEFWAYAARYASVILNKTTISDG